MSDDPMELTRPLQAPRATDEASVHDLVAADIDGRKAFGLAKYGTILQASNGRDHLVDAYQEALDLCCYLRAAIELRRTNPTQPYSATDPSTWTRAQLVAELEAREGLRAPEGWQASSEATWERPVGEVNEHGEASGGWMMVWAGDHWWGWYPTSGPSVEPWGQDAPLTLTGPDGAFARAEKAAGGDPWVT